MDPSYPVPPAPQIPPPLPSDLSANDLAKEVLELQKQLLFCRQELEVARGVVATQHVAIENMRTAHADEHAQYGTMFEAMQAKLDAANTRPPTHTTAMQTETIQCTDPDDVDLTMDAFEEDAPHIARPPLRRLSANRVNVAPMPKTYVQKNVAYPPPRSKQSARSVRVDGPVSVHEDSVGCGESDDDDDDAILATLRHAVRRRR